MKIKLKRLMMFLPALILCVGCQSSDSIDISDDIVSDSESSDSAYSTDDSYNFDNSSDSDDSENSEAPSEPDNSEAPSEPDNSEAPSEPDNSEAPSEPQNPVTPSEPQNPVTPSEPQNPVTPSEPQNPISPNDSIQTIISKMSLKERVYQMFFVVPEQITGTSRTVVAAVDLSEKPVGGILYMGANLESVSQARSMISGTQSSALKNGIGAFIAVDEEGGTVARCALKLGTTAFSNMAVYGARNNADEAYNIGKTIGADIKSIGFNVDFAPVADVDISPYNELGSRIFSDDPNVVANMASNVVRGLRASGVAATLKHFPGLGAENGNTHTDSAIVIDRTLEQLRSVDFVPFKSGIQAGAEFVMVGHQQMTAFNDGLPADLSYAAVTTYLRGELGFSGIAITDAQRMNTITDVYDSGTAAVMSVKAGIDMILTPADFDAAFNAVYNAVLSGEISESRINESVTRILTVKRSLGLV